MPDASTPPAGSASPGQQQPPAGKAALTVPPDVQQKHGDLVELIAKSESMNDEERQYWVNILPIMTPEQIQNLRDILENERKQLAAIDAKYKTEIEKIGHAEVIRQTEEQRRSRREQRTSVETKHRENEEQTSDALLKQIEGQ